MTSPRLSWHPKPAEWKPGEDTTVKGEADMGTYYVEKLPNGRWEGRFDCKCCGVISLTRVQHPDGVSRKSAYWACLGHYQARTLEDAGGDTWPWPEQ
jgi:hypothetical protein